MAFERKDKTERKEVLKSLSSFVCKDSEKNTSNNQNVSV